jgi:hypothetical protein
VIDIIYGEFHDVGCIGDCKDCHDYSCFNHLCNRDGSADDINKIDDELYKEE